MSTAIEARPVVPRATAGPSRGLVERVHTFPAMGGQVRLQVATPQAWQLEADRDLRQLADRIRRWAARITRFDPASELGRLNHAASDPRSAVGPSLGALLRKARRLASLTDGLVDVSLLDARLAAEHGSASGSSQGTGRWRVERLGRGDVVLREDHVRFDLDGVGKGWIADRALAHLAAYPAALADADGDIALRVPRGNDWGIAIADPSRARDLVTLVVPATIEDATVGIATSGTTVHRWELGSGWAHHLIDPRTGASAETDVIQATVVADGALVAEALAKAVVIAGSSEGLRLLQRAGARAAFVLLEDGQLIATPGSEAWLA